MQRNMEKLKFVPLNWIFISIGEVFKYLILKDRQSRVLLEELSKLNTDENPSFNVNDKAANPFSQQLTSF